jgi:hypothetical protein
VIIFESELTMGCWFSISPPEVVPLEDVSDAKELADEGKLKVSGELPFVSGCSCDIIGARGWT